MQAVQTIVLLQSPSIIGLGNPVSSVTVTKLNVIKYHFEVPVVTDVHLFLTNMPVLFPIAF